MNIGTLEPEQELQRLIQFCKKINGTAADNHYKYSRIGHIFVKSIVPLCLEMGLSNIFPLREDPYKPPEDKTKELIKDLDILLIEVQKVLDELS